MFKLFRVLLYAGILIVLILLGIGAATIPMIKELPVDKTTSLNGITTIEDAVAACRESGLQGWELVRYAQKLTAEKITYSRLNPWDSPARAFARGMGYCQQQALALQKILWQLDISSKAVYSLENKFPPKEIDGIFEGERISAHTWLRVKIDGEERDVCPGSAANEPGVLHFIIISEVRYLHPLLKPFSHLGSIVENIKRYRANRS